LPIYSYCCPNCGYEIVDIRQTLEEHEKQMICPKCGEDMWTKCNLDCNKCGEFEAEVEGGM
jgi:putative FmdB family regulatory protein